MKVMLLTIFLLFISNSVIANDKGEIEERFNSYQTAMDNLEFDKAVEYVDPRGIKLFFTNVSPIFLELQKNSSNQYNKPYKVIFNGKELHKVSPKEFYLYVQKWILSENELMLLGIQEYYTEITEVSLYSSEEAEVFYNVLHRRKKYESTGSDKLRKYEGEWYLQLKEMNPTDQRAWLEGLLTKSI